jgi:hypothetical protein
MLEIQMQTEVTVVNQLSFDRRKKQNNEKTKKTEAPTKNRIFGRLLEFSIDASARRVTREG